MSGQLITGTQRPVGLCIPPAITRRIPSIRNYSLSGRITVPQNSTRASPRSTRMEIKASAAANDLGIESVGGIRPEVEAAIEAALDNCLTETDVGIGKKYRVRRNSIQFPSPQLILLAVLLFFNILKRDRSTSLLPLMPS